MPRSAHQVQDNNNVDDDPIVNEEEIDTNNSMDDHSDVHVSQTYKPQTLKKWRVVPPVQENFGKPGEIGLFHFFDFEFKIKF